ncbi:CPBP family intramembrane metalloprotease [Shewanella sp. AS1]|uniref:CPBP family intramembrane glutamic endopeptidase n=1 Tax=Shewanella sp. AS1 TaxID=2907626 RepID=UPI001F4150A9|nr:CPBP family intramembrane glutamic endopeptidase [Shewanella sp. AS1]MCE9677769.1 CPBP family intramembrane metalloprotease [Shewanella sp. AS1]
MSQTSKRIWISLVIYLIWISVTLLGAQIVTGGEISLSDMVTGGIGWHFAAAIALLVAAILVFKWKDLQFSRPHSVLRVMWFPSLYLLLFVVGAVFLGLPPFHIVVFIALNTLMVGFSEEIMFRGILFRAFEKAMNIWPAILITSVLFGAVHSLNVFITGDLMPALMQSIAATMSGLVFLAILLRTGSIWPAIIYHFFWDCLLFLISHAAQAARPEGADADPAGLALYAPILLNLPNLIFALFMLRNIGKEYGAKSPAKG